ncbi:transcriptional regulator [candidate division TM6 bacterium RIFCSPHIGHO2_12_FULL_38_8]|nr:MAG: transcriptional regulator [candidate division TM6 bacterium RIFCSPHIGHO2_12_FULL_38_8]
MAGHSKWANIKHKKAKEDAKRGKEFTKLVREITIAAKTGGDPAGNPRLRHLIDEAKDINMPQENIQRAIKKGTGELPGVSYESVTYEGHGPNGVAIMIEVLTDNKNRAVADLRATFLRHGGHLAETGSVNWMFERLGIIRAQAPVGATEDSLFEQMIDFDIKEISLHDHVVTISVPMQSLHEVTEAVKKLGMKIEKSQIEWVAKTLVTLDPAAEEKAFNLLEKIEDYDDVQNLYTNVG